MAGDFSAGFQVFRVSGLGLGPEAGFGACEWGLGLGLRDAAGLVYV